MDGRKQYLRVAVQSNRQVVGVALIIHDLDLSAFMLHAHDGFPALLTVNNDDGR